MRRCWTVAAVVAGLITAIGCGGFGAAEDPGEALPAEAVPAETEAPPEAVHTAEDTGGDAPPDEDAPPRAKAKRKGRPARPPAAPRPEPPAAAPKKKKPPPAPGPKPDGVEQVGDGHWRVARALVERWHDDPYQLGNVREQEPGWELIGVRVKDAYHLGMRNKDVVIEVNGHKLRTKPQLLSAYLDLKNDRSFAVTFVRAGATKVHRYDVVD